MAVFITHNQAGSTGLLVVGGIALLIGLVGRAPDRIGKEGVAYDLLEPTTKAVDNVLSDESVPLSTREIVAEAVQDELDRQDPTTIGDDLRRVASGVAAKAEAVRFEAHVIRALALAAPPGTQVTDSIRFGDVEVDAALHSAECGTDPTKSILFEVSTHADVRSIDKTAQRLAGLEPRRIVYITSGSMIDDFPRLIHSHAWKSPDNQGVAVYFLLIDPLTMTTSEGPLSNVLARMWASASGTS